MAFLSTTLVAIDVTLAALFWAWAHGEDILARLVKKTLYVGFFAFLIGNFHTLTGIVLSSFSGLGLKAGGVGTSAEDFLRPGKLAALGLEASKPILQAANDLSGFPGFFENAVQILILLIVALLVIVSFFGEDDGIIVLVRVRQDHRHARHLDRGEEDASALVQVGAGDRALAPMAHARRAERFGRPVIQGPRCGHAAALAAAFDVLLREEGRMIVVGGGQVGLPGGALSAWNACRALLVRRLRGASHKRLRVEQPRCASTGATCSCAASTLRPQRLSARHLEANVQGSYERSNLPRQAPCGPQRTARRRATA
ncbi:type IV secretion system protein [Caulobacter endophyticus]|uniref:type IV secretion system protein n=1 Tax=Caulobacter endophyticus TaxID=2172652 RepID=UPI003D666C4C